MNLLRPSRRSHLWRQSHPWPLWRLVLRTPRLELRPDDDAGLVELLAEACRGVHPPAEMPFGVPWTDARTWVADEYFVDGHHLLADGAAAFSERFGRDVLAADCMAAGVPPVG